MEENMYENKILDAIQMLVDNAIDKATFDKTIRGVISKCVDEKNGKYIVIYQDSSFYAYSTDTSQTYSAGTPVYVLVPRNDMKQTKTIIGSVNKLGSDYINTIENTDRYEAIGNSVATLNSEQGVCSYKVNGDALILYDKTAVSSIVNIDTVAATTYIKQAKYLTLGGEFRTALAKEQRYKGNYGLGFDINFTDNMTNETVKRTYLVDVNNMLGNPYEYTKASNQKVVFDIDGANFVDIDKIYLFCYDFPVTTVETKSDDIFVVNLTLEAAAALTDDELAGNKLTLITPQGIYFSNNDSITSSRKIDTEVKIDNKVVNKDSSLLKYFWFKENYSINTSSLLYNRYGGNGWECLNEYNIVETDGNNNPTIIDWITNQSSYLIRKSNTIARETDYKCVVSYNNEIVLTKKFTVYNYSSNYVVTIDSDSGTYFSYDNGRPTLTCLVNQTGSYEYVWGMMNGNGAFTPIQETTTTNAAYHTAADRYAELEAGLRNGTIVLTTAIQQEFSNLKYTLEQYNNDIMRVEDNVIYNLKLNMITNFATFVCSVYNNGAYIGKGSIKIENDLNTSDNSYTLIINNGDQVFKYNGDGISPTSRSLDKPQELYPLSFTLYDEKGNEISNDVINADKVYWTVPTSDTMIKVSAVHGNPSEVDEYAETATYTGYKSFNFEIPVLYTANKTRNTIQLKVKYKNKIIVANTELMFLKEGESGSNGTDFICRIVPNTIDGAIPPLYPIVTWNNNAAAGATNPVINFTPRTSGVWFKAQLYHNGSEIFNSPVSGPTTEDKNVTIKWEMMKNKYDTTHLDASNFSVNSSTGVFSYDNLSSVSNTTLKDNPVNIVKCTLTYDGIDYVATMPIILVKVNNSGSAQYKVELVENTGFRYAMYTTDGRTPIYDNSNPFALKVIQTVENTDQDISTNTLTDYAVDYNWSVKGLIYANDWETQSNLILDTLRSRNLQKNEKYYKPVDDFNGLCLSNALFCDIKRNNVTLATIHLPIHMYLNRYGNAAMNSWDGNSIAIDNDGGFILAPQVGAGKKEQDNSFTGVFMGSVKEAGSSEEEVGLFGYNSGARTLELNSKDGSAKFGKVGKGQIIIEPGEDKAVIQSGDYEMILSQASGRYIAGNVYFRRTDNVYTELDEGTDYHNGDNITGGNIYVWTDGSGMEIDLNDPHIRFGSGNFRIDPDGNVYAKGYATIAELEAGDVNIPGIENWKAEYATDRVQFETDSTLTPVDTNLTKTITGKCLYKDSYVSGYTVQLVDVSGNPITHDQTTDGIGISTDVTGQIFTISFNAQSQYTWTNAVNNYNFKFSYTPIGSTTQTIIKQFSANAVIMAEDGRSITSVEVRYQSGTSGTIPPSDESGWVVNPPSVAQGNYLWTRTKINYSAGNPDISYSVAYMGTNGASSYTYVRYSINSTGNPMVDTPTSETKYVGIYSGNSSTVPAYTAFTWSKYVGENGTNGTNGADGNGIKSTSIQYRSWTQGTGTPPSTGWENSPPTVNPGEYLWTKTVITYDDNSSSTSYSVARMGVNGQQGPQGPQGEPGKDGTSVTVKGSYNTLSDLITAHPSGNTLGDGYVIGLDLYIYTNAAGGGGSLTGDWNNVGQFKGDDAYTIVLSNESHTFPATDTTAVAGSTTINVSAYKGATAITPSIGTITGQVTGLTTSISGTTITVTVTTSLTTRSGELEIPITVDGKTFNKVFSWSLAKAGTNGSNGTSPTAYSLIVSHAAIVKAANGTYTPGAITLTAKSQTGNAAMTNFTTGRYAIFLNGSSTATSTPASTAGYSYTIPANTTSVRIALYNSSTGTTILDEQTVPVVYDGINGTSPYNVILTNESQSIAGSTTAAIATTITTNVIGYMGTTQQNTTVGTITGLPTGMTAAISNNSSTNTSITFTVTTSMTTKSGQVTIPVTMGSTTINKTFSYSLSLKGATGSAGIAAKVVSISPSSQIFKSTTGANGTFTPQYIYLYPDFQGCSYSKWQYSTNGTTWTDVTSGSNSLTIGTYNSIANSLRIERNSNLYTSSITSVSFKCISNTATVYDIVSIAKIYDVTDIEIGGRNLLLKSNATTSNPSSYLVMSYNISEYGKLIANQSYALSINFTVSEERKGINCYIGGGSLNIGEWKTIATAGTYTYEWIFTASNAMAEANQFVNVYSSTTGSTQGGTAIAGTCNVNWIKLEKGTQTTDWTAAPEDLKYNQFTEYTTTNNDTAPAVEAEWTTSTPISSELYIWQRLQTRYENGIVEYGTPVCIYIPAIQIDSIEEQYFIHTSNTIAPPTNSTSWLNKKPEWKDEYYQPATRRYLWIRTKYTYTGNISKVEYSTPYYDPTWETISALNKSITDNAQAVKDAINNGYVTIKDGYIEIKDTSDPNKGILLSKEGISFKVNGNTYTSVWALDGTFNAQSILVKNLNASNILSGTLTLQEDKDHQENNGVFLLKNESGNDVAKIDVNGLKITAIDGSYIYLRTGEDNNTKKGIYLVDATGNIFVSTDTTNGIFTVTKQVVNEYQEFSGKIRIIQMGNRGIGFIGI